MSDQKQRWAARAAMLNRAADNNTAKAEAIERHQAATRVNDPAFWTQPGKIRARDAWHNRSMKAYGLRKKAEDQRWRAAQLDRMANTHAGDAARRREAINEAAGKILEKWGLTKGQRAFCGTYNREVTILRVNAKSVTIQTESGFTDRVPKSDLRRPAEVAG